MFRVRDVVMHPTEGVCRVTDLREEMFSGEKLLYYLLVPLRDGVKSKIYVPVNSAVIPLRRLLTKAEIRTVLARVPALDDIWCDTERERVERFGEVLRSGDHARIIQMIALLHHYKDQQQSDGKKFHKSDEHLLKEAEAIIHSEFSYALGMDEKATISYIMKKIAV